MTTVKTTTAQIDLFLASKAFAVAGASVDRAKYGNKVLRAYQQKGRKVVPVHPREKSIEGLATVASVLELPAEVQALSIVTPPAVTLQVIEAAAKIGIKNVWMQPGAESPTAIDAALAHGMNVIADGTCVLVVLKFHE
ncbi:MAG: CoA-binding protein [Deltaproteobacteria bacterium]|nr:CoA-binding protein [Deltaproteobacteria bacterium]